MAAAVKIAVRLHGQKLKKSDLRSIVSASCFAVAQQHHNAILILLAHQPPLQATAFALLRLLVEATVRGSWLSHCATDEQVENFVEPQRKQLDMASMQIAIDKVRGVTSDGYSLHESLYKKHWGALSEYTHTSARQVQHWLTTQDIEPVYSDAEVSELLKRANVVAECAAVEAEALLTCNTE